MTFFKPKKKPGVYFSVVNRRSDALEAEASPVRPQPTPTPPEDETVYELTLVSGVLFYSGDTVMDTDGTVIYSPALTVTEDGVLKTS